MLTRVRHIFQTVTEEDDTGRIRSVHPGEKVQTMADVLDKNAEIASNQSVPETQKAVDDMVKLRYEFTVTISVLMRNHRVPILILILILNLNLSLNRTKTKTKTTPVWKRMHNYKRT